VNKQTKVHASIQGTVETSMRTPQEAID